MIPFPKRKDLVTEAQRALNLRPLDGIDGRATWHALGFYFLGANHPAMRGLHATASGVNFVGRSAIVKAVQSALRIAVDGLDGSQTWSAIMERLTPSPITPPAPEPVIGNTYKETERGRSPNRNPGRNERLGIVVHHACGYFEGSISWILKTGTNAAYHCLIAEDGTRAILGEDTDCCHHAGKSSFGGRSSCNGFMLGVAFCGDTNTGAMRKAKELNPHELASLKDWVDEKRRLYHIPKDWITHHRVVSPGRKDDISLAAWEQVRKTLGI